MSSQLVVIIVIANIASLWIAVSAHDRLDQIGTRTMLLESLIKRLSK